MAVLIPWARTVAISCGLAAVADTICQRIEIHFTGPKSENEIDAQPRRHSFMRTARFMLSFGIGGGTSSFFWYTYVLPAIIGDTTFGKILLKVLIDNTFYNAFYCSVVFSLNQFCTDGHCGNITLRLRHDFIGAFFSGMAIFVPWDLVVFTYLPSEGGVQTIGIKIGAACWLVIASYLSNRSLSVDTSPCPRKNNET
eukprot:TRINITY_DN11781_c0_g1_i1.p1 TRINITY_DN11781_c0_g1~~TRINITY_DN11781_c0_g1_i1.p1  ORF type:complete len:205 (+),score=21.62 TRINITY_DN11781_c0_g1_i1:25-615(+)